MNCGQFEARLNLVLDQRRSPADDSALVAHAADCASCDELLADHVELVAAMSRSRLPALNDGFAKRIVVAAGTGVVQQRRMKKLVMAACVALSSAAAMLLAISLVWKAREAGPSGGEQVVATPGMNSADFLVGAPGLWSKELAMAGGALRFDEVDKIAPGFRPLRESLAMILDALRRAWSPERDAVNPPAEKRTGQWTVIAIGVA